MVGELLDALIARGVELWCEGDRLRCRAPRGTLTGEDNRVLREHKAELIALLRARAVDVDVPMSATQQALWFVQRTAPASTAYNTGFAGRIRARVDVPALRRALATLMDRHAVLRAMFSSARDGPIQRIRAIVELPFAVIDASTWSDAELDARVRDDFNLPFHLEHDPVLRCRLFSRAADDHVLLVTIHHIAFDGGSVGLLFDDLRALYRAEAHGGPTGLPALPATFADHVSAEQELLAGPRGAALWQWWQERLEDAPPLEFVSDRPRPPLKSYRGASVPFFIGHEVGARVKGLSQQLDTTPYAVLLSAFAALLARYTGQTDVVLGTPMSVRPTADFERVVGCFMNLVPLRIDVTGDPTFVETVRRARDATLSAIEHRAYPFSLLASRLPGRLDSGRAPLCQVAFAFQTETVVRGTAGFLFSGLGTQTPLDFGGLQFEPVLVPQQEGQFDLLLEIIAPGGGDELAAHVKYDPDLFHEATIQRFVKHFARMLAAAVQSPDTPLSALPLLTEEEIERLAAWNRTERAYPQLCLHALVRAQAQRTPDAIAIWHDGQQVTYGELVRAANRLAHRLKAFGIGPEQLVGVCLDRTPLLIVALLAVLEAGGAYVPLDPTYPRERLARILEVAQVPLILTASHLEARLPAEPAATRLVLSDWTENVDTPDEEVGDAPDSGVTADHLAYVIFTSGSTGRPKGVAIPHRCASNLMHWARDAFTDEELAGVLGGTSICFDLSVFEIFVTLSWGGRLVLVDNVLHLVGLDHSADVRLINTVPSAMAELLRVHDLPPTLRTILLAGERLTSALVDEVHARAKVRLINLYAPSETTTYSVWTTLGPDHRHPPPIGLPMPNQQIHVLDAHRRQLPVGVLGEAYLGGDGVARGYLNDPVLTEERFVPDPFRSVPGARLYRTGDIVRRLPDGQVEYEGRADHQVKLRGFRIELDELDEALARHPDVAEAVTVVREHVPGDARLCAYVARRSSATNPEVLAESLRRFLAERLPHYMVPSHIQVLAALPHTPNGKIDRRALPEVAPAPEPATNAPSGSLGDILCGIWRDVLGVDRVGIHDNFFDLGGHSLLLVRVHGRLTAIIDKPVTLVDLLRCPTIQSLVHHIDGAPSAVAPIPRRAPSASSAEPIAVVGMACRFPGADTPEAFFANLCAGVESVTFFSDAELAGVVPRTLFEDPAYVKARAVLADIDQFDAGFFGYAPHEAELLDPQQRLFLEVAWEALERAGVAPAGYHGRIGLYAGSGLNTYLLNQLGLPDNHDYMAPDAYQTYISSDKDFLTTRVCYKFGLTGPGVTVQTACSTSLVAIHLASESLRRGECDVVMAGGATISVPHRIGYVYRDGMIASADGHCRPFDAGANGTVFGSGVGVVVLKRLTDALAAGDRIEAVIRGSAINNDGAGKVGYTAPGVAGQTAVITAALHDAGVDVGDIGYVETHGTGTLLGDAVEATALCHVFAGRPATVPPCVIGAVKSNVGHLDAAAGVAGFIKTVLAVKHGRIPPTLHFTAANPNADLAGASLRVAATLSSWPGALAPRRAGVSAFGIGGTNAHVVVEEPPAARVMTASPLTSTALLPISARHPEALRMLAGRYAAQLREAPASMLDMCASAGTRRVHHPYRAAFVAGDSAEMLRALDRFHEHGAPTVVEGAGRVVFVCPGQGSQWAGMGRTLLAQEPVFAEAMRACDAAVARHGGFSVLACLRGDAGAETLERIDVVQPALFSMTVALGALWRSWGIEPDAVIGHSMGELAAAHIAGALSLDDAARVICVRSRMLRRVSGHGAMGLVELPQAAAAAVLSERPAWASVLSVAAANSRSTTVIAGEPSALESLLAVLSERGVFCRPIKVDVASHSPQVDSLLTELRAALGSLSPLPSTLAWHSTVNGELMEAAPDAAYWARNLREPVRFADGIAALAAAGHRTFIEISPHPVLLPDIDATLHDEQIEGRCLASLRREEPERRRLLDALATLYVGGHNVTWGSVCPERGSAMDLPTYPWQRQRYWVERRTSAARHARIDEHPLLGRRFDPASDPGAHHWETDLDSDRLPFLADHRVRDVVPLPAAAYLEAMLAAAAMVCGPRTMALADVSLERMLILSAVEPKHVQVSLRQSDDGTADAQFLARDGATWHVHARGRIVPERSDAGELPERLGVSLRESFAANAIEAMTGEAFYDGLASRGFGFGPAFRVNQRVWRGHGDVLAELHLPLDAGEARPYQIHPVLLDGLLQLLGAAALSIAPEGTFVPVALDQLELLQQPSGSHFWGYARLRPAPPEQGILGDLALYDDADAPVIRVHGLRLHRLAETIGLDRFARSAPPSSYWHIGWRAAQPAGGVKPASGGWLLLSDEAGYASELSRLLTAAGTRCVLVQPGTSFVESNHDAYRADIARTDHVQRLLEHAFDEVAAPCRGIVHLATLGTAADASRDHTDEGLTALACVQAVARLGWRDWPRLWLVTAATQPVRANEPVHLAGATLSGVARTLMHELPALRVSLVDVSADPAQELAALTAELRADGAEDQVALRGSSRWIARFAQTRLASPGTAPVVRPDASYLVTGGLGALGLAVAQWMAAEGAGRLWLVGRRPPSEQVRESVRDLVAAGTRVETAEVDVTDAEAVADLVARIDREGPPLGGIVHAAGVLDDGVVLDMGADRYLRVVRTKALGAWTLHELTRELPLDFFVLFSSGVALLGGPAQANHAAANAYLDALAHHRRRLGLPAIAIDWGPWSAIGHAAALLGDRVRGGIGAIDPACGVATLGRLLAIERTSAPAQVGVFQIDVRQWRDTHIGIADQPLLSDVAAATAPAIGSRPGDLRRLLAELPVAQRRSRLEREVTARLSDVLGVPPAEIKRTALLATLGVTSLLGLEIRNRLESAAGLRGVSATLVWAYPTVAAISGHLAERLGIALDQAPAPIRVVTPADSADEATLELARELASLPADLLGDA